MIESKSGNDAELENAFCRYPEKYFQDVYARYSGPLFRFLYRFTQNNEASEEILQDIFVELLNGKFKSIDAGTLKSWLFTVAKNRGLNFRRKSVLNLRSDVRTEAAGLVVSSCLETDAIAKNLLQTLSKAEMVLPQDLRDTWALRKSGLEYSEIAQTLSIPVGTVKSRFSRIVEYLRKEFEV